MIVLFGQLCIGDYFYFSIKGYGKTLFKKVSLDSANCHLGNYEFNYNDAVDFVEPNLGE